MVREIEDLEVSIFATGATTFALGEVPLTGGVSFCFGQKSPSVKAPLGLSGSLLNWDPARRSSCFFLFLPIALLPFHTTDSPNDLIEFQLSAALFLKLLQFQFDL